MNLGTGFEHREKFERRERVILICPDNDPESHMILLLAEKMGMATLRSKQKRGATLDKEENIVDRVVSAEKSEVWIVEMPGLELEKNFGQKD